MNCLMGAYIKCETFAKIINESKKIQSKDRMAWLGQMNDKVITVCVCKIPFSIHIITDYK